MKTAYELKDGEVIHTPTEEKVATYDGETLRMARGFAEEHKESVEAWISANAPVAEAEPAPAAEAPVPRSYHKLPPRERVPPPPAQDPNLGEKTPEYWAWFSKYYPEIAAERYQGWNRPE